MKRILALIAVLFAAVSTNSVAARQQAVVNEEDVVVAENACGCKRKRCDSCPRFPRLFRCCGEKKWNSFMNCNKCNRCNERAQ